MHQLFSSASPVSADLWKWSMTTLATTNPFYIKVITGNIRICQGCRDTLYTVDGQIPAPPYMYDLTIARAEQLSYRDTSGNLITPRKATTSHYHCWIECIKAAEPNFVPWASAFQLIFIVNFALSTKRIYMGYSDYAFESIYDSHCTPDFCLMSNCRHISCQLPWWWMLECW